MNTPQTIVLAFSGGLDTSFCVPWLRERYGRDVITVTVDTGGLDAGAREALAARSQALGAIEHRLIDARELFFQQTIRYLVMGNVLRGHVYPLCVGAERGLQAQLVAEAARDMDAWSVAHGSTAAGNDQVRFEVAFRTLAPEMPILAPVRDEGFSRQYELDWLADHGFYLEFDKPEYSINRGLWGCTIGGKETGDTRESIPEDAWVLTRGAFDTPREPSVHTLSFEEGVPKAVDGEALEGEALIEKLDALAGPYGIGRGIHLGDTIFGLKGRVAFEAPAATTLITCHRELEKLVLTARQQRAKDRLATVYGELTHEAQPFEPLCRDIEAFFLSSQRRVTGEVRFKLRPGNLFVEGVTSSFSMRDASRGVYGEAAGEWTAADARGYSRLLSLPSMLYARAGESKE